MKEAVADGAEDPVPAPAPVSGSEEPKKPPSKIIEFAKGVWAFCYANWLIFAFGLAALMGYLFPHVAAKGGVIRSEYSILYGVISLIFLINAMQLSPEKLREHALNWRLHIVVQGINLLVIPVIQLVIVQIVIAAGGVRSGAIEPSVLAGMIVASCIPTTIASNVVMTRNAGGDEAAAIIEVVIGNVLGSFLTPWLIYAFLPTGAVFDRLRPAPPTALGPMYAAVMKQLGLSVLLPLVVGQVLRWNWPTKVLWLLRTFYLPKLCSALLATLVWSTFSGAFETGSIYSLSTPSVVFNVLMNVTEYALFTVLCFYAAYPPTALSRAVNGAVADSRAARRWLPGAVRRAATVRRMDPAQVVAVCFCGAAKTTSLGIPLIAAMWSQVDNFTISSIQVPVLLYTVEQVFVAQFFTIYFKHWMAKVTKEDATDAESAAAVAEPAGGAIAEQRSPEPGAPGDESGKRD